MISLLNILQISYKEKKKVIEKSLLLKIKSTKYIKI